MKAFSLGLISTIIHVEGFAPSGVGSVRRSISTSTPLFNHNSNDDVIDNDNDIVKFVAALTLAGGMMFAAPGAVIADTPINDHLFNNIGGGSSVVISGSIKDSDIADFSMPSYQEASRAEVNSNLKGDNYLLGEASKNYVSSSSSSVEETPKTEVVSAVDEKAEKEAAKAAQKAARANQIAAAEAAAKAAAASSAE